MLSATEAAQVVANLAQLKLEPVVFLRVCGALAPALTGETTASRGEASNPATTKPVGSGAAPHPHKTNGGKKAKPAKLADAAKKTRRRVARTGELLARAKSILKENPDMGASELARAAGCSEPTARRAKTAFKQAKPTTPSPPANRPATSFLRGMLSQGPQPASYIEEMAAKRQIGAAQLEAAKQALGVRVGARTDGGGTVYLLPSHADAEAAEA